MNREKLLVLILVCSCCLINDATAAEQWREAVFPPPNAGKLVYTITNGGNPACASYDGRNCLWGQSIGGIDFSRVRPLVCGVDHRNLYGVTGFEDPNHWCNLAQRSSLTQTAPPRHPQPADEYRLTGWSGWERANGVEYRYRVRWIPANSGPGKTVEGIYEARATGTQGWTGAAHPLECARDTWVNTTPFYLSPGETKQLHVRAPNCGNAENPSVRLTFVRSVKID